MTEAAEAANNVSRLLFSVNPYMLHREYAIPAKSCVETRSSLIEGNALEICI